MVLIRKAITKQDEKIITIWVFKIFLIQFLFLYSIWLFLGLHTQSPPWLLFSVTYCVQSLPIPTTSFTIPYTLLLKYLKWSSCLQPIDTLYSLLFWHKFSCIFIAFLPLQLPVIHFYFKTQVNPIFSEQPAPLIPDCFINFFTEFRIQQEMHVKMHEN